MARQDGHTGVQTKRFFDATLEVLEFTQVGSGGRTIRVAEDPLQFVGHFFLMNQMNYTPFINSIL